MKVEWSVGDLNEYGVYWIEYYIGSTKKVAMELLNYYDDLPSIETDEKFYMFDSYENLLRPTVISNNKIIRYSLVEKPEN